MSPAAKASIVIGVLSVSQLAFGQGRHGGGRDENRPMSNDEITQRIARTEDFLKKLDANGNGMIDPDEASDAQAKNMLDRIFGRMGKEPHYPMAIREIMQGYESYYRTRGNTSGSGSTSPAGSPPIGLTPAVGLTSPPGMGFGSPPPPISGSIPSNPPAGKSVMPAVSSVVGASITALPPSGQAVSSPGSASSSASSPADTKPTPRKPSRFLTAHERLPKGLPDWFLEKDVDGDGQITMAEFTTNWTPDKVAEFARYDLNHDGIITAAECLKVEKPKAK